MKQIVSTLILALATSNWTHAKSLVRQEWLVNGAKREALVYLPSKKAGAPVIFAFHGHGGTMQHAARRMHLETLWPEAIVVYPQGSPAPTVRDPAGRKAGWLMFGGDRVPNRDLEFFDAILKTIQSDWKADPKRVYATGHSNGGGFVYYLWGQRPEIFAALAPLSAGGARLIRAAKPCPLLHIGAKNDTIVDWETQQVPAYKAAQQINGKAAPVEVVTHDQGHQYPNDAPPKIIAFFRKYAQR
jgi:polyhydroxybutyrate depolymerase